MRSAIAAPVARALFPHAASGYSAVRWPGMRGNGTRSGRDGRPRSGGRASGLRGRVRVRQGEAPIPDSLDQKGRHHDP